MAYRPIDSYGLIGNMRSAALVGGDGSIDWLCLPQFDSPSIFAAILDEKKGGRFSIAPTHDGASCDHYYLPDTNVLVAKFHTSEGLAEILDFMPVQVSRHRSTQYSIVRVIRVQQRSMTFSMRCEPRFDYARADHSIEFIENGAIFSSGDVRLFLSSSETLRRDGDAATAQFTVDAGSTAVFGLCYQDDDHHVDEELCPLTCNDAEELLEDTIEYWRQWISNCTYNGRWRETVRRSALALKMLIFEPTGAIIAAPTCSLPERIGGSRNWDYRYTWIRDASFTIKALLEIGFKHEAANFMQWLQARCHDVDSEQIIQPLYRVDGQRHIPETILDHLEGYRCSGPVRIGNHAHKQLQLDVYGTLLDAAYLHNKNASPLSYDVWQQLDKMLDWVAENWHHKDNGIWEVRGEPQQFVSSNLMCWVALDRGLRIAESRAYPAPVKTWRDARDAIYEDIMKNGWCEDKQSFVQHYNTDALDASNLLMPLMLFISPTDRRMTGTFDATSLQLASGGLSNNIFVHRYNFEEVEDGVGGGEGSFNPCTFWLIDALTLAGEMDRRRLEEARIKFERMMGYANHLGLFAEETGADGAALGNFPQGLSHLTLITSILHLDRALDGSK